MTHLNAGDTIAPHQLTALSGDSVAVPDPGHLVHLELRRFAGCPVCNLHLRSVVVRNDELLAAGVREVVVFHSTDDELRRYVDDLPFAVVGDPDKSLYAEFGIGSGPRAVLDPRAVAPTVISVARQLVTGNRGEKPITNLHPTGGRLGLPADFLIGADGRVIACKYGTHANDQWSVDEVLAHAS